MLLQDSNEADVAEDGGQSDHRDANKDLQGKSLQVRCSSMGDPPMRKSAEA